MKKNLLINLKWVVLVVCFATQVKAQDDLLSMLGADSSSMSEPVTATFKTTRVVNFPSVQHLAGGVLDVKISHRFGFVNTGIEELFGLDASTVRLGADYGITDGLMIGFGRSTFEKTLDGFFKWRILRQTSGKKSVPVTVSLFGATALKTQKSINNDREDLFVNKLFYTGQVIIGSKISEELSLQVSPTIVHRNLTSKPSEKNDVLGIGAGGRIKLTKRISLNAEYMYLLPDQISTDFKNSLSLGFDIETGGHVFQLHFTNSTAMNEKGYITETVGDWANGDIHFGFNISRVFNTGKRKK